MNFFLDIVNAGVVDDAMSGSDKPFIVVPQMMNIPANTFYWIMFAVLIAGVFLGIGIRHVIQIYKEAPDDPPKPPKDDKNP